MTEKSGQLGAFLKQHDFREINHVNVIFCSQFESGHERKGCLGWDVREAEAGQDLAGQGLVCSQCEGEGADFKLMVPGTVLKKPAQGCSCPPPRLTIIN